VLVATLFEPMYSDGADQNTQRPLHIQNEITHYNEVNDRVFNIDIDMNIWEIARNVIEQI
jgi:hypothetical protein